VNHIALVRSDFNSVKHNCMSDAGFSWRYASISHYWTHLVRRHQLLSGHATKTLTRRYVCIMTMIPSIHQLRVHLQDNNPTKSVLYF